MALKMSEMSLVSIVLLVLLNGATAQSGCTMAMVSLSSCVNYITGNSSSPSPLCCSRLSNVVQTQPQCLCGLLKGGASNFGIAVNQSRALAMPGACDVTTPPVSQCDAVNGPATSAPSPADSPSDSPSDEVPENPDTPSDTDIPSDSGIGSKTVPGPDGSFVGGSNINGAKLSFLGVVFLLASSWAGC